MELNVRLQQSDADSRKPARVTDLGRPDRSRSVIESHCSGGQRRTHVSLESHCLTLRHADRRSADRYIRVRLVRQAAGTTSSAHTPGKPQKENQQKRKQDGTMRKKKMAMRIRYDVHIPSIRSEAVLHDTFTQSNPDLETINTYLKTKQREIRDCSSLGYRRPIRVAPNAGVLPAGSLLREFRAGISTFPARQRRRPQRFRKWSVRIRASQVVATPRSDDPEYHFIRT